jgi:LPXTG-motif cell wall-anchored protein
MFHTLQEYLTFTKGVSYVLGGLTLLGFIGFWLFLTRREKR